MNTKTDNDFAWEILNLIFRSGEFYIDTMSPPPERFRLCIDGTDYGITEEQVAWLERTFWSEGKSDERD